MITIEIGPDPLDPIWTIYKVSCVHNNRKFGITHRVLNEAPIRRVLPHIVKKLKRTTRCTCGLPPPVQALLGASTQ